MIRTTCPTDSELQQLSTDQVVDVELRWIEEHVTDCSDCQERLQRETRSLDWINDMLPLLQDEEPGINEDQDRLHAIRELLGPTDDPDMLGRVGSYEVSAIVGQGGMGAVLKAHDLALNRTVAIKMLQPHLAVSGAARKRFKREAQAAAAVVDDHVLPIFGVDQWCGTPYVVMQFSRGKSLQKRIEEQGPLQVREILRIGLHAARGLAAAHAQGLVHRDVKPSNLLLDDNIDRAMLADFGLARAAADASLTRTGIISGTPQYMSPEQIRGESIDARSDLFSLGSTLYAMCTGRPPFRADSAYAVMHQITHGRPERIRELNPDIPDWLEGVIDKLMSLQPEDRFESADQVANLLEAGLAHVQQPNVALAPENPVRLAQQGEPCPGQPRLRSFRIGVVSLATLLLIVAGVIFLIETSRGTLRIECMADGIPVRVYRDRDLVEELTVNRNGARLRVAAGYYRVEIVGRIDAVARDGDRILVTRGTTQTVTISLDKSEVAEGNAGDPTGEEASSPDQPPSHFWKIDDAPGGPSETNKPPKIGSESLTVVTKAGTYRINDELSLEVLERNVQGFGGVYRAVFRMTESTTSLPLRYEMDVATEEHRAWVIVCDPAQGMAWVAVRGRYANGSSLRAIDLSCTANIVIYTRYADENFDLRIPERTPLENHRCKPYSIGAPMPRIPDSIDRILSKQVGLALTDLVPNGPYIPSGQLAISAVTEQRWIIEGRVETGDLSADGLRIQVVSDWNQSVPLAEEELAADGTFRLQFSVDLMLLGRHRTVELKVVRDGQVVPFRSVTEDSGESPGRFSLCLSEDEDPAVLLASLRRALNGVGLPKDVRVPGENSRAALDFEPATIGRTAFVNLSLAGSDTPVAVPSALVELRCSRMFNIHYVSRPVARKKKAAGIRRDPRAVHFNAKIDEPFVVRLLSSGRGRGRSHEGEIKLELSIRFGRDVAARRDLLDHGLRIQITEEHLARVFRYERFSVPVGAAANDQVVIAEVTLSHVDEGMKYLKLGGQWTPVDSSMPDIDTDLKEISQGADLRFVVDQLLWTSLPIETSSETYMNVLREHFEDPHLTAIVTGEIQDASVDLDQPAEFFAVLKKSDGSTLLAAAVVFGAILPIDLDPVTDRLQLEWSHGDGFLNPLRPDIDAANIVYRRTNRTDERFATPADHRRD